MDASALAFSQGVRSTRAALRNWRRRPGPVLRGWLAGALLAAVALLVAVWVIGSLVPPGGTVIVMRPPFAPGGVGDVATILGRNLLVLALHAMACVAGFIAGSSLPGQAAGRRGLSRTIHEHGGRVAIGFVACATAFSLFTQAWVLGTSLAALSARLAVSPALLVVSLLPHALPELVALFLPLAAWIIASRRGLWHELLAATVVTVAIAVPVLVLSAVVEVLLSPRLLAALT